MKNSYLNKLFLLLILAVPLAFTEEAISQEAGTRRVALAKKAKANANKLEKVCKNVTNINGLLVKVTAGGHIPRSDPRYSGYSIVCAGRCVSFPAVVYHCDGSQAFRMGYYGRWVGNGKSRGYCGHGSSPCPTSSVRAKSKSLKCSGAGYLSTGNRSCMRFNLYSDRNGGV